MASLSYALFVASFGLLIALCAGIVKNGKVKESIAFSLYITAVTLFSGLVLMFPDSNTPELFMVKQGLYDSLLFGMALEIAYKAFAAFRGIAYWVRGLLALAVALSSIIVLILTPANQEYADIGRYQPGITTAGLWCLTFVALLIVWYQIPVPSFTRAIILGYVPYLVVFVVCLDLLERRGWGVIENVNVLKAAAYDACVAYLAYAAWRKD